MIEISDLRVQRDGKCICAVDQLSVTAGEHLAVQGGNGSGKTTLLRVLAGLTNDYSGQCTVSVDRKDVTYLHQQPFLFRESVLTNARYGERDAGATNAKSWLDRLQVGHLAERSTGDLSGGERRRIALARALATQPQLLLLDEPLADLDDHASEIVCQAIQSLSSTTIIIASPVALPDGLTSRTYTLRTTQQVT